MSEDKKNSSAGYGGYPGYGNYGGGGGYYYGYGYNYGGGYGGGAQDQQPQRSLKDYLVILRERIWYFVVTFFVIFTGTLLYTFNTTELFRSAATLQVLRDDRKILETPDIEYNVVASAEDFNTQVKLIESMQIVDAVAERIKDDERQRFMAPYTESIISGPLSAQEILVRNRSVTPIRLTMLIVVQYSHPDPAIARTVANYFADEYINFNIRQNIDSSMRAVEDLKIRVQQQKEKVEEIRSRLVEYRVKSGRTSLNPEENTEIEELRLLNTMHTEDKRILDVAETQWNLVQEFEAEEKPLWDLPIIADMPRVSDLLTQRSTQAIGMATLKKRYREKHPAMIEAMRASEEIESELEKAINSAIQKIKANYQQAKRNYDQSSKRLAEKEDDMTGLNKIAIEYRSLEDELMISNSLYQVMTQKLETEIQKIALIGPSARILDEATQAPDPYKPNIFMNLAVGTVGGIVAGIGLVFVIAFLDDRIKSAYDIEHSVGLPLIGIVPRIKRLNSPEKAQAVASNSDRRVTESFRAIHSALKLNEASKKAKIIVVSSTSPSEGKSFVTTNMALTFAIHGEKTLVIDADLRMPNVAKSLGLEEQAGVVQLFNEEDNDVESLIYREYYPNLDVLCAGGKAKNPTQILNSPEYEQLLAKLSESYDRIMIDSPPIAAVSDVLTILPNADGLIYVIKFNAVKKKTAKANLRRLIESNTPVFGAVLNQISTAVASYYYANYYDKSYQDYYTHDDDDQPLAVRGGKGGKTIKEKPQTGPQA
ncbi:polysaccharide biosynthesis tyrosine autokinase [Rubellicoccus peritrichatus]|uniref:non-specific protein-tyrosine kinase n=1 Tax=Rubellicoccus peritrichatus TaxID=3080537 RepID=A0AAQ3LB61_9BACT|nr:polysaccharide biosynthesis tyrosine autokinase [Puniceicoccus sp. CR14]WOO41304.1 polysaccharide biosynthesis tyrosine autokinase [Puniceicoccus sp. CR14]